MSEQIKIGDVVEVLIGASEWMKEAGFWEVDFPECLDRRFGRVFDDHQELPDDESHVFVYFGDVEAGIHPRWLRVVGVEEGSMQIETEGWPPPHRVVRCHQRWASQAAGSAGQVFSWVCLARRMDHGGSTPWESVGGIQKEYWDDDSVEGWSEVPGLVAHPLAEAEVTPWIAAKAHQRKTDGPSGHGPGLCPKVPHEGTGYLHGEDDDTPYRVDGLTYCGRCHRAVDTTDKEG